jgi:hypothetical protein
VTRFADAAEARAVLGGFFARLPAVDPLVRALLGDTPLTLRVEARAPRLALVVDLGPRPLAVRFDAPDPGTVALTARADDLHDLLTGALPVGAGLTRKRLLARGSAARLMGVMPLLFLAPPLYREHLAALGRRDLLPPAAPPHRGAAVPAPEDPMNALVARLAWLAGYALGFARTRLGREVDLLGALEALGRGLDRAAAAPPAAAAAPPAAAPPRAAAAPEGPR